MLCILALVLGLAYLIKSHRYKAPPAEQPPGKAPVAVQKPPPPPKYHHLPRVAIVIDDLGYNPSVETALIRLTAPLSFSLLPFAPHTKDTAALAYNHGKDVLLHLPMEPTSGQESKVGPGAISVNMDDHTLATQVQTDMEAVPYIKGVNNHMGSRFTADTARMEIVLGEVRKRGFFYIDSRTTPLSKGLAVAQSMGVKSAKRDIFLDNVQEARAVRTQLARLISTAYAQGSAIGIGHPHPITYQVLKEQLPDFKNKVELVPISELVQ